jgi:phosphatidylserine/phosphatidylglycerophosphate/cardiolipin synthase-like enzyme
MRVTGKSPNGDFAVRGIAGTHTVMMAMNCPDHRRKGLRGFAFWRDVVGDTSPGRWLRSLKVFKSVVPDPKKLVDGKHQSFTTDKHPVQSFLWSDYTARPATEYRFKIVPMYGTPKKLEPLKEGTVELTVKTEPEDDSAGHGVWFNRGAIASQAFAREFNNIKPSPQQLDDLSQPVTQWLSRGLLEACLRFINETPEGDALRACVYEFTYKPVLNAFKAAIDRGVDVKISYHETPANAKAIKGAELPKTVAGKKILFPRTVPKIPHNKFIVRLTANDQPVSVWTGSTNMTPSGFLGQSNVGHRVNDTKTAKTYLAYWTAIAKNPKREDARKAVTKITPHPPELPAPNSVGVVFSPRHRATMLTWYGNRMIDAAETVLFTAAFGVNKNLMDPLARDRDFLRFVLMEKWPTKEVDTVLRADRDLIVSYGAVLGEVTTFKDGKPVKQRIKEFGLDKWFLEEEHFRKAGNIFFVHTKFLLVDPLSEDPLVCTGSANFSDNSLLENDENMLIIRGNQRVADIYLTEFDRIFRHFYFRDVANEIEQKGGNAQGAFLDESEQGPKHWTNSYFKPAAFKTRRREMFFATAPEGWAKRAGQRTEQTSSIGDTPTKKKKNG